MTHSSSKGEELLWLVWGSVGEYSDRVEWPLKAFADEGDAKALVERLDDLGRAAHQHYRADYGDETRKAAVDACAALDPSWRDDYTGPATYTASQIPFRSDPSYARLQDQVEKMRAERDALVEESAALTRALTGLTRQGSEYFVRRGDRYVADIPVCVKEIRERLNRGSEALVRAHRAEKALSKAHPQSHEDKQ